MESASRKDEFDRLENKLRQDLVEVKGGKPAEEEAPVDLEPVTDEEGDPEP